MNESMQQTSDRSDDPRRPMSSTTPAVSSGDTLHEVIARHWCDALRVERVDEHDNFFDLGGTSLTAIELASAVNQTLGVGIDARLVFGSPTLATFRESLHRRHDRQESEVDNAAIERGRWPLLPSHAWFFSKQFVRPEHFCVGFIFRVADLHLDALRRAITLTVDHHDALRTQFRSTNRGWEQVLVPDAVRIEHHDLVGLGLDAQLAHIREIGAAMAGGFAFGEGPLVRFATIDLGPERGARLLIVAHSLLADYGSWRIVVGDIERVYRWVIASGGRGTPPLVTTTSAGAWALWLNGQSVAADAQRHADYWRRPRRSLALPIQRNAPGRKGRLQWPITGSAVTAIVEAARRYRVNADVLLLAAFSQVIAEWCGTNHVSLDLISDGRTPAPRGFNLSRTVGWLTLQAPLYVDLPSDRSAPAVIGAIRRALDDRLGGGIGYAAVRFGSAVPEDGVSAPLTDAPVCFNYLGSSNTGRRPLTAFMPSNEPTGVRSEHPPFRPLELYCAIADQQVLTAWSFDANAIDRAVVERLAARFAQLATALAAKA